MLIWYLYIYTRYDNQKIAFDAAKKYLILLHRMMYEKLEKKKLSFNI